MEKYYKALTKEGFVIRLIRIEDSIGAYDAFDLISGDFPHFSTFILDPKPNEGWEEISLDEYSNLLLDTMEERKLYNDYDTVVSKIKNQCLAV